MTKLRRPLIIGATMVALLASGCSTPTEETPAPQTPTTPELSDQELYDEASRVYLKVHELVTAVEEDGSYSSPPSELGDYVTGEFSEVLKNYFQELEKLDAHVPDGRQLPATVIEVKRDDTNGIVARVTACKDGRAFGTYNSHDKQIASGQLVRDTSGLSWDNGKLKIATNRTEEVESCES